MQGGIKAEIADMLYDKFISARLGVKMLARVDIENGWYNYRGIPRENAPAAATSELEPEKQQTTLASNAAPTTGSTKCAKCAYGNAEQQICVFGRAFNDETCPLKGN